MRRRDLSERARDLVKFDKYRDQIEQLPNSEVFVFGEARPQVWPPGVLLWIYPHFGSKEQWPMPGLPIHYSDDFNPDDDIAGCR